MIETRESTDLQYALDGNSVAGLLREIFGVEMTENLAECAHCGKESMVGEMLAFGREMGTVLRCPGCHQVLIRVARRPDGLLLDMQGVSCLRVPV